MMMPDTEAASSAMKGTPASLAMARARSVLPAPGGPSRSMPLGIRPPRREAAAGLRRNSTTSVTSSCTVSMPAMASKPWLSLSGRITLQALVVPIPRIIQMM